MPERELRKLIRSKIEAGEAPQQVYDELHGPDHAADEQLAELVRYVPTLERRAQHRAAHRVLLGLIVFAVAWKLALEAPVFLHQGLPRAVLTAGWVLAYLAVLVGVARYWRRAHALAGLLGLLDLLQPLSLLDAVPELSAALRFLLLCALAVLGYHLGGKLPSRYIILKERYTNAQGEERLRPVVRFGD